ncbi:related to JSN1 - RNA-binding protein (pumilio family) [Melanopsichium pennsylvanicum]|uniref:Related to JSN1 - RNA-binding protein (Pumilio family) n=2 Tax=Melanopsichium pennsylvanicum TaxID=63383 RepID=A0AAJ4XH17_9BASI|nr:related to JSN1-RNA-binding protein (pumilio family) [Melanopsichium pennsylvanicum 4]SNX81581.1 related to JSN1 - RNA-binding protein (pumilio family) [Melanopsichium pennsylvanicum]
MQNIFNNDGHGLSSASASPSSLLARRALQLHTEEAYRSQPPYRTTSIANESDPIVEPTHASPSNRGRARAGTLPSSWGENLPPLQPPSFQDRQPPFSSISPEPPLDFQTTPLSNLTRGGSATQLHPSEHPARPGVGLAPPSSSARLRSGSLTLPPTNLANAFGPSFFSSHWQPTRSGLSNMTSAATDEESNSPFHSQDEAGQRFSFDNTDMLDYLGLAGTGLRDPNCPSDASRTLGQPAQSDYSCAETDAFLASAQLRNRSSTLGGQQLRPRLNNGEGRARSSSYLPSFAFNSAAMGESSPQSLHSSNPTRPGILSGSQSPYTANAPQSSLLNTALQNRLHQYSAASSTNAAELGNRGAVNASRPRATSMGVLDQPSSRAPLLGQYRGGLSANLGANLNIFDSSLTPPGSAENLNLMVPSANLASHLDSPGDLSTFLANGRNRAGTIAALSGPDWRARAEQQSLRMTQMQFDTAIGREAQSRPHSSGAMDAVTPVDMYARSQQHQKSGQRSGANSPFVQPTRTLWIGHLRPTIASQDVLQAFSHYGPIETFRLVPEKGCAFVNYIDIADAIRAREDIVGRLGGRLGLGTIGSEGQVRIGFGKPDSVPQAGLGGFAPTVDGFGGPLDFAGTEVFGAEPANQEPSRALWIGSIPASTATDTLVSIFVPFGSIESVRVLASKSCAFINFERLDDAMMARKALNGREVLGAEVGPVKIGFAKVPSKLSDSYLGSLDPGSAEFQAAMETLASLPGAGGLPSDTQISKNLDDYRSVAGFDSASRQYLQPNPLGSQGLARNLSTDSARAPATGSSSRVAGFTTHSSSNSIVPSSDKGGVPLPAEMKPRVTVNDLQMLIRQLDESDPDTEANVARIARPRSTVTYYTRIPPVPELAPGQRFDNNRLKEVRRRLETPTCTLADADAIARDYLSCVVDLSSDFIGNTLVQKFFERCSEPMKKTMLELIAPHLATIGVHKNGTWAAQKIIDCTHADDQRAIIATHIRPYVPPLLLDQFGNYVVQRLIPFGSGQVDFIFDAMVDRCWEIAQGRFGSRSMRACLESVGLRTFYIKQVALAIVLNSVPLATSQNGALLVTWLLDASALTGRFKLLAPRFAPHLANLCTHKLASQTILRVISQKQDPEASRLLLKVLFDTSSGRPRLLEEILVEQVHGSQFVTKLFAKASVLEGAERQRCGEDVKAILVKHGLVNMPPYRPLAVEMGLIAAPSTPSGGSYGQSNGFDQGLERHIAIMNLGGGSVDGMYTGRNGGRAKGDSISDFDPWAQDERPEADFISYITPTHHQDSFLPPPPPPPPQQQQQRYISQPQSHRNGHESRGYL